MENQGEEVRKRRVSRTFTEKQGKAENGEIFGHIMLGEPNKPHTKEKMRRTKLISNSCHLF